MKRDRVLIEVDELLTKINDPNVRVYDATMMFYMGMSPEEAAKMPTAHELYLAGHLPGAVFFPHDKFSDLNSPYDLMLAPDEQLVDQIGKIGIANDSEVIVYAIDVLPCATRAWWPSNLKGTSGRRCLPVKKKYRLH